MKKIIVLIILFTGLLSCAQKDLRKNYEIEKTIWKYEIPKDFKIKIDNFKEIVDLGNEYFKKDTINKVANDDVVLLSIVKSLNKNMNMLSVSYRPNDNITQFTIKGYAEKMKELFENTPNKNDPNIIEKVIIEKLNIDGKEFYNLKKITEYIKEKYTYTSEFIVTEIDKREFSFVLITDNLNIRAELMNSLINSEFE